ncbi:MAG: ABC transporter ATP-binding protein [Oscillospiraceae bacterium]|nr:ABC transporter ATP-binding protein [Oscillospiraceae bacterium]
MSEIVIEAKELTKQYIKQKAVKSASFAVKKGSICGLIGPNGSGKTTIMKMLGGLVLPTAGSIEIYGASDEKGLAKARSRMSFIIETPYAKEALTARENLEKQRIQKGIPDKKRIDEVLELVGLSDTGKKPVKAFSLGMRQRLGIANALLTHPEIMVLDEPINGLDPEGIIEIRELLKKLNREEHITIVISSHILSELSLLCTDYIFIRNGDIKRMLTADELKKECTECYYIHTDNDPIALAVLNEKIGISQYDVDKNGGIRIYEKLDEIRTISKTLYENGVIPLELSMREANLEQYYMNLVGGDTNVELAESSELSDKT